MSLPVQRPNLVAEFVDRMTDDFKTKRVIRAFAKALATAIKDLDDAAIDVIYERLIDNATGARLETLAILVGEPRNGRSDAELEAALLVRIRANRSQATTRDVYELAALLLGGLLWEFHEQNMGAYQVVSYGVPAALVAPLAEALRRSRPLGYSGHLITTPEAKTDTIRYASATAPGSGRGRGSVTAPSLGRVAAHSRRLENRR